MTAPDPSSPVPDPSPTYSPSADDEAVGSPSKVRCFHGTRAELRAGDLLRAGFRSNYRPEVVMNHVYVTALADGAGLSAELSVVLAGGDGTAHVYEVEPTGPLEDDPNVTDRRFPANPTRSYRSQALSGTRSAPAGVRPGGVSGSARAAERRPTTCRRR